MASLAFQTCHLLPNVPVMTTSSPAAGELPSSMEPAYIHHLQCSRQWRGFLAAQAEEFASALPPQELATLMARIGMRFAAEHPLSARDTVQNLQDAINHAWSALDWGVAELGQSPAGMEITHRFSPLAAAFGEPHADWATGFLQGAYQQWFDAAGGAGLRVEVAAAVDALAGIGVDMKSAPALFGTTVVLSNLVSNVPAVMLLLPVSDHAQAGPILALASTLAGNLLLVGSIANLIVADQAGRIGR